MAPSGRNRAADLADPSHAFTPARFEKELKDLAAKAKSDTWERRAAEQASLLLRSGIVILLLAIFSNVSLLSLSPVYGSIPSAVNHSSLLTAGCFTGWAGNLWLGRTLPIRLPALLAVIAIYTPMIQFFLYTQSATLTAQWGPLATELLTLFPLSVVSSACVATLLDKIDMGALPIHASITDAAPGILSWAVLKVAESATGAYLHASIGNTFLHTRVGLEMLLAGSYAVLAPSRLLVLTLPAIAHLAMFNTHVMLPSATSLLQKSLAADKYVLLDRQESLTGYISVLESVESGFRVMRCDHSLLGGEWTRHMPSGVPEPIYAVFVMLEAVRLVEMAQPVPDHEASALVIGLGIGTTSSALVAHGITTTTVEIDPVVHEFAVKYFRLPENHTSVIDDAVGYTARLASTTGTRYDYIVHDVFTGGAEPLELFTLEFLQGLSSLLKPGGVIAINYAGDVMHPAPKIIIRTIREVFPTCRIFRELPKDGEAVGSEGSDFTNVVIFCTKSTSPLTFRRPVEADFLGSMARRSFMLPLHEVSDADFLSEGYEGVVLRKNSTSELDQWQRESAAGHWKVMRTVLPPVVWEKW